MKWSIIGKLMFCTSRYYQLLDIMSITVIIVIIVIITMELFVIKRMIYD